MIDTTFTGDVILDHPGQVLSNTRVFGCITVSANDVTIRNSEIYCTDAGSTLRQNAVSIETDSYSELRLVNTLISGGGDVQNGIGWGNYELDSVEITGFSDGARMNGNYALIESSYIHDLEPQGDLHSDALQSTSSEQIEIRHSFIDPGQGGVTGGNNAAIMLGSEQPPYRLGSVTISDNYIDGGGYAINIRADSRFDSIVISGNVFGTVSHWGQILAPPSVENTMNSLASGGPIQTDLAQ